MKRCFFIGHGDAVSSIYPVLLEAVERHISNYGVTEFVVGRYGRFDEMASRAVRDAKRNHEGIKLTLLMPYHPGNKDKEWTATFDESLFPFDMPVPPRYAIVRANNYMIDHSEYLICYVRHAGKARDYLEYARRLERKGLLKIENIANNI